MRRALAFLFLLAGVACSRPGTERLVPPLRYANDLTPPAPSEEPAFRRSAPPVRDDVPLPRAAFQTFDLDNGLRVILVERHGFPTVAAQVVVSIAGANRGDVGRRRADLLNRVFLSPEEGVLRT